MRLKSCGTVTLFWRHVSILVDGFKDRNKGKHKLLERHSFLYQERQKYTGVEGQTPPIELRACIVCLFVSFLVFF